MTQENGRSASKTALLVAAYRGRAASTYPNLCSDPWAKALAGAEGLQLTETTDRLYPHMELWIAMRTYFLDRTVQTFTAEGIQQIVILGAGLDSRGARLSGDDCRYFLVDHPASQADRQKRLEALPNYPQAAETAVPCDFETEGFIDRLKACGFNRAEPALILWEGVVYYLREEVARQTLKDIAHHMHPKSVLAFDYFSRRLVEKQRAQSQEAAIANRLAQLGEPLQFGINDPTPLLSDSGFRHVRTVSFDEIALSATGTYERERQFRFQHIATASVDRFLWP